MISKPAKWIFHCQGCTAEFEHPDVEECPMVEGGCAHLHNAGWRGCYIRVFAGPITQKKPFGAHIFSQAAQLCPNCFKRYLPNET